MTAAPSSIVVDERYRIERPLSEGGVAIVYRAFDLQEEIAVAIKVLKPEFVDHDSLRPRFEREAQVLAELQHPNIVRVTDFGVHRGSPYLVMDLLQGRTLRALLDQGPPPEAKVRALMVELLDGLAYAHARGVVHRDLKPGNLFLQASEGGEDQLKILDFGFAKLVTPELRLPGERDLTRMGTAFGTPAYMAPEQITLGAMDTRTDVYGAGVVLFEMLAGEPPFRGELAELLRKQLNEALPLASRSGGQERASSELQAVLERALAKRAQDRFESAAELKDALAKVPEPWLVSARSKSKRPGSKPRLAPPPVPPKLSMPQPPPVGRASLPQPPGRSSSARSEPRASLPQPPGRSSQAQVEPRGSLPKAPRAPASRAPRAPAPEPPPAPRASVQRRVSKPKAPSGPVALAAPALELDEEKLLKDMLVELERGADQERAARLHGDLGACYERREGELERALMHYQRSIALEPERVGSLRGARRVLIELDKVETALPLLDKELALSHEPAARAALLHEKGRLLEHRLRKHEPALLAYEQALELDASQLDVLRAAARLQRKARRWDSLDATLERLANAVQGDVAHRAAVVAERARLIELRKDDPARALELHLSALALDPDVAGGLEAVRRLSEALGQWQTLLQSLEQEAVRAQAPDQVAGAYAQMAKVFLERLGDREQAITALQRALAVRPDERARWLELSELYAEAGRSSELVNALEHCVRLSPTASERCAHLLRMARCLESELASPERAERCYLQALELEPRSRSLLDGLAALYEKTGNQGALLGALARRLEAEPEPSVKAELWARMGDLSERLGDVDQAVERHKAALALEPDQPVALRALDRLLPQLGRHRELVQAYERVVEHSPHAEQAILYLFRLGALYEDRLNEPSGAVHAYERVLRRAPSHLGALHALQRAAAAASEHDRLARALVREAELLEGSPRAAELLVRAADVQAGPLGQPGAAIELLKRVLIKDASHRPAADRLAALYRGERRWDDLVALHQAELERLGKGPAQAGLLFELGELCESKLGRVAEAIAYYERALAADPGHGASWQALERLLRASDELSKLAEWLERRAAIGEPLERAERACALAEIYATRLSTPERALAAYARALATVPGFAPALEGRARVLGKDEKPARLVEALLEQAALAGGSLTAVDASMRAAALQAELLADSKAARTTYARVRELAPGQVAALRALETIERELGDHAALRSLLAEQAERTQSEPLRAAMLRELAVVGEAAGDAPEALAATYRAILSLAPGDAEALYALCRMDRRNHDASSLSIHEAALAARCEDRIEAAGHQIEHARILEAIDPAQAMLAYRAALALDPESSLAVRGFSRSAVALSDAAAVSEAAKKEVAINRDTAVGVGLLLVAARIRAAAGDLEGAVDEAQKALDLAPDHEAAAEAVRSCLFALDDLPRLCSVLSRAAEGGPPTRAAELHAEVALLFADRIGDATAAMTAAERALSASPGHVAALSLLARLQLQSGQHARAAASYEQLLTLTTDPEHLQRARLAVAELAIAELGDAARAHRHLRALLAEQPDHRQALALELRLLLAEGQGEAALGLARRRLEGASEPQERARALMDVAVAERACGRTEQADSALCEAIAIEGADGDAAKAYGDPGLDAARMAPYAGALERHFQHALDTNVGVVASARALAAAQSDLLRDDQRALATLKRALTAAPNALELALSLADRQTRLGRHDEAVALYRREASRAIEHAALFRGLAAAHRAAGRPDEALAASQALLALDADEGEERVALRGRQARPAASGPGQIGKPLLEEIGPDGAFDSKVIELAQALSSSFSKAFPADLKRYGLTRRDRVATQTEGPLRAAADRVARLVGAEAFELYVHDVTEPDVAIELSEPPALLVPRALASAGRPKLVFALSRKLLLVAHDLAVFGHAPEDEVTPLLIAAARRKLPGFGSEIGDEATLLDAERSLSRALPWLARKRVDDAADRLAGVAPSELAAFGSRIQVAVSRAALLLSDDVVSSLEVVRAVSGLPPTKDPIARDLLAFWVGDLAARHRARLLA